jgi:hypothetical protein
MFKPGWLAARSCNRARCLPAYAQYYVWAKTQTGFEAREGHNRTRATPLDPIKKIHA